ncbi:MAG: hypothetical protein ACI3YH_09055 [Eubacteriales bacterium]
MFDKAISGGKPAPKATTDKPTAASNDALDAIFGKDQSKRRNQP